MVTRGFERISTLQYTREQLNAMVERSSYDSVKVPYDPVTNSATIVSGDTFDLGNGYKLIIKDNDVDLMNENGRGPNSEYALKMRAGMEAFMRFSNQRGFPDSIWTWVEGYGQEFLDLIKTTGVDVTKEFTINQTKCTANDEGKISESGNTSGMPSSMYYEQLKRHEEFRGIPINQRTGRGIEECLKAYNKL